VIDLRWIRPLDLDTIRGSVARTGRLLVVEEQVHAGGWGATVIARLAAEGTAWRAAPAAVSLPDHLLIPYSPPLEDEIVPSTPSVVAAARAMCARG
jgi:pyruvate/2-oxoglutarate/acetoin dehydrogenase E1 component